MCPHGLALDHPAAELLSQFAREGCPVNADKPWFMTDMAAAITIGPHVSAMDPAAMQQLQQEMAEKVKKDQCRVILWDDIKHNPPEQLNPHCNDTA